MCLSYTCMCVCASVLRFLLLVLYVCLTLWRTETLKVVFYCYSNICVGFGSQSLYSFSPHSQFGNNWTKNEWVVDLELYRCHVGSVDSARLCSVPAFSASLCPVISFGMNIFDVIESWLIACCTLRRSLSLCTRPAFSLCSSRWSNTN